MGWTSRLCQLLISLISQETHVILPACTPSPTASPPTLAAELTPISHRCERVDLGFADLYQTIHSPAEDVEFSREIKNTATKDVRMLVADADVQFSMLPGVLGADNRVGIVCNDLY